MLHAVLVIAAEEADPSKSPFYLAGGALVAWAVLLAYIGLKRPGFPGNEGGARGVMAITAVLMAAAMATAVITA